LNSSYSEQAGIDAEKVQSVIREAKPILQSSAQAEDLLIRLASLEERLFEGRFHLAALGQTKRGKSSLLNALLGEKILPTSVIPLTAIPTFISWGAELKARITFKNGTSPKELISQDSTEIREYLAGFISEELNPENRLQVEFVELSHPATILKSGLVLIDTPGIGSTFQHNTEVTLNFLPQCDAGLFVFSPDPPITDVELAFLKEVRVKVNSLFFVFNKADYLTEDDLEKSISFLKKTLEEKADIKNPLIFPTSSTRALKARKANSDSEWEQSGFKALDEYLTQFLAGNKQKALSEAIFRKTQSLLREALMRLDLSIASMKMPIEILEEKRERLKNRLKEVQAQRQIQQDLMDGDQRRFLENLEMRANELRERANNLIKKSFWEKHSLNEKLDFEKELSEIISAWFEHEFGVLSRELEQQVKALLKAHQKRAEDLIEEVRKDAAEIFEIPFIQGKIFDSFELERNPHWVTHQWDTSFGMPPVEWLEVFLPSAWRKRRLQKRINRQIEELVSRNVENLRWSTLQIFQDSFRRFREKFDQQLAQTSDSIQSAIEVAYKKRQEQAESVAEQLALWEDTAMQLRKILDANSG